MRSRVFIAGIACVAAAWLGASSLMAGDGDRERGRSKFFVSAKLQGFQEVPTLSTSGNGRFWAVVDTEANTISYKLSYEGLEGAVAQAHVHLGARAVNGGIMFFLCTNAGNGPAGTPACPAPSGEVSGMITPEVVIGPAGQGVAAGEFAEVVAALRNGAAYANVHSSLYPAGEIRGQVH
jgi:hypothetical protein